VGRGRDGKGRIRKGKNINEREVEFLHLFCTTLTTDDDDYG